MHQLCPLWGHKGYDTWHKQHRTHFTSFLSLLSFHFPWHFVLSSRSRIFSAVLCVMRPTELSNTQVTGRAWLGRSHTSSLHAVSKQRFCFFFFLCRSWASNKLSYPLLRRSHTEWQVFLPRSHLTANPLFPCATWSFQANHGGGSKTSPCLQLCDSQVSRAPCCCSGNSKGSCWGFRVPWDERRIPPRTLGQWCAASHENLGQFRRSKLLQQSSCNRSQSARGVKSFICLVLLFLSSSLFILFIFLLPALFYWHDSSLSGVPPCVYLVLTAPYCTISVFSAFGPINMWH